MSLQIYYQTMTSHGYISSCTTFFTTSIQHPAYWKRKELLVIIKDYISFYTTIVTHAQVYLSNAENRKL